jgi:hypothetical protein
MKKKIIATAMGLSMCISVNVMAAEPQTFSFHSGTEFGMSSQEIQDAEIEAGNIATKIQDDGDIQYSQINIAGINDSEARYEFENDEMIYLRYQFPSDYYDEIQKDYAMLSETLNEKYGEAQFSDEKNISIDLVEYKSVSIPTLASLLAETVIKWKAVNYEEWLIPYEDNYVIISHYVDIDDLNYYAHRLSYLLVDKETVDNMEYIDINEAMNNDL